MARIRSIKPAFWSDYRLAQDLTRDQRLFYIALWNEADDEGRFLAHPRRLLGAIFPYDEELTEQFVSDSLNALAATDRLLLYVVDGEPYGQLTRFLRHQRINRPQPSPIPAPPAYLPPLTADSVNAQGLSTAASLLEGKGKGEGVGGGEGKGRKTAAAVGEFLRTTGTKWKLAAGINEWADQIDREPKYAGIDIPFEIRRCAEWHEGKGKKPKDPAASIRNWLGRAKPEETSDADDWFDNETFVVS